MLSSAIKREGDKSGTHRRWVITPRRNQSLNFHNLLKPLNRANIMLTTCDEQRRAVKPPCSGSPPAW